MSNDIYEISARIKNIIAREDMTLSPAGKILVNYFSLMMKDLYDFSDTLPEPYNQYLKYDLSQKESVPMTIIKVSTPKDNPFSFYSEVMNSVKNFGSNVEALRYYMEEYDFLGSEHDMQGDEYWMEAEKASILSDDHIKIMKLRRAILILKYLVNKEKIE